MLNNDTWRDSANRLVRSIRNQFININGEMTRSFKICVPAGMVQGAISTLKEYNLSAYKDCRDEFINRFATQYFQEYFFAPYICGMQEFIPFTEMLGRGILIGAAGGLVAGAACRLAFLAEGYFIFETRLGQAWINTELGSWVSENIFRRVVWG